MNIQPQNPFAETNTLLRAIILLLANGPPPRDQVEAFLASVGIGFTGPAPGPDRNPADDIVQFPTKDAK